MNIISFFVFASLGLYLENVLPSAVGVRRPFYYPFTKAYWFDSKSENAPDNMPEVQGNEERPNDGGPPKHDSNKVSNSSGAELHVNEKIEIDVANFEDVPEYLRRKEDDNQYMKITDLKKKFDGGFYAINGLYGEMYSDQIFALLGHNGAGKTTAINVLCGMLSSSSGNARIFGLDVKHDMKQLRRMMGICPQHNILFPKLT
jgi:ATP-binding cassette subfamily A (ABC1) protein 3